MKRCPTCDKTFDDGMKFCQTDGTPLVEVADAAPDNPFTTVVARQDEIASAIPVDPFKTMVAPLAPKNIEEDEILELPEEPDMLKTMVSSPNPKIEEQFSGGQKNIETPSSPFDQGFSLGTNNPETAGDKASAADSSPGSAKQQPDPTPFSKDYPSTQASYEELMNTPIPSPFDESMIGYEAMSKPLPPLRHADPASNDEKDLFGQSPYNQPAFKEAEIKAESLNTPYANQVEQPYQPMEQSNWSPPPAPDTNWQNQQINQNSSFQPPSVTQGQNQTLPIISLVLGIVSLCCYISPLTGIAALITGYLGMKNANTDPMNYGGKTLAIVGMVLGGLFLLISIIYWILIFVVGFAGLIPR